MRRIAVGVLWVGLAVAAGREQAAALQSFPLRPEQPGRLGLRWVVPEQVGEIPLREVPAVVTVPPWAESVISASLPGLVEEVLVARGDRVVEGQILARLHSPEILVYQQHLLDAWQDLKVAEARQGRERPLFREGIIAKRRWLETRKIWRQARTAFEVARRELMLLGMDAGAISQLLSSGRLDGRLDLRAPFKGVVSAQQVRRGQRVDRLAPLFRVTGTGELWLEMAVPLEAVARLRPGARVMTPQGGEGEVFQIGGMVDAATQTVPVRARLMRSKVLRPGRKLAVQLYEPTAGGVLKVPRGAVVAHGGGYHVFVRAGPGTGLESAFQVRLVTLAGMTDEAAFIRAGVAPGEAVAVQGVAALKGIWLGVGAKE